MTAYYNEIDPFAAEWLRQLINAGHIAPGDVDTRSIVDVRPDDLRGYTQCHFFAGIGVWSYALRRAGWPDERPVWTGSCPCQPFSAAGAGAGFADERHLWPHFHWLIDQCRPPVCVGEQVASKDGLAWLDLVQADLEGSGYASAAIDTCSAGVGAPHIRQRLYWMAYADNERLRETRSSVTGLRTTIGCPVGVMDDDDDAGLEGQRRGHKAESGRDGSVRPTAEAGQSGGLADAEHAERRTLGVDRENGHHREDGRRPETHGIAGTRSEVCDPGPTNGFWRDADWLFCRDGKWRPVEPGTFPLAHGAAARVGRLRGYGNAINAVQAQIFIEAVIETIYPEIDAGPVDVVRLEELFA